MFDLSESSTERRCHSPPEVDPDMLRRVKLRTGLFLAPLTALVLTGCGAAPSPSASTAASPSGSTSTGYRMSEVAEHNTQQDCWAAVDGDVYDLTSWISRHPGGADKIIPLCGTDASAAFRNQHGSQERPNQQLTSFRIGTLVD